jgi:hypothetical protein
MGGDEQDHSDRKAQHNGGGIFDPKDRPAVEQEVADRAAANPRDRRDQAEADNVHLLA